MTAAFIWQPPSTLQHYHNVNLILQEKTGFSNAICGQNLPVAANRLQIPSLFVMLRAENMKSEVRVYVEDDSL